MVRDLVSMAADATERCRVWPKTAAQGVKCVRAFPRFLMLTVIPSGGHFQRRFYPL